MKKRSRCSATSATLRSRGEAAISGLPIEVVDPILAFLDPPDHIRLGAVCKSLRQHVKGNPPTSTKLFLLPFPEESMKKNPNFLPRFLKPPTQCAHPNRIKARRFDRKKTMRHLLGYSDGRLVVYCSKVVGDGVHSWYGAANGAYSSYYFDRMSGSTPVYLPSFTTQGNDIVKIALSSRRSSMVSVAACIRSGKNTLHVCRPEQRRPWIGVSMFDEEGGEMDIFSRFVFDIVIHREKLWVASDKGLYVGNVGVWPPVGLRRSASQLPTCPTWRQTFLGESEGRLLAITKHQEEKYVEFMKVSFCVWELREGEFVRWSDLYGGALLLSKRWLVLVEKHELGSSLMPDCIYYELGIYRCHDSDREGEFTYAECTSKKRFLFHYLLD